MGGNCGRYEEDWENFCGALRVPEWITDKRFTNKKSRMKNRGELDKLIANETIKYMASDITDILQKVDVAATPVMNCEDQLTDPHFRANKTYVEIQHPLTGKEIIYNNPAHLSDMPLTIRHIAPSLGEHNDDVLRELLGYSQREVADMVKQQIIY